MAGGDGLLTIDQFCTAEQVSRAQYYVMQREGWGPDLMWVGTSVRISPEARAKWRREREAAAASGVRRKLNLNPPEAA
jgi:hypothetical protein